MKVSKKYPIIAWWSGGITSAVTCKLCLDMYKSCEVRIVFIDTKNEDDDTYRFLKDCERWYSDAIETITNDDYESIQEVWYKYNSLNVAHGAICSSELKRTVRERFQKVNKFSLQAFGFDINEMKRVRGMELNYSHINPVFPLIGEGLSKDDCMRIVTEAGIDPPVTYKYGFRNNNCFKTGCIQGGIGYWQKMQKEFPDKFNQMATVEHDLTDRSGRPVTMLKDQAKGGGLVFLKPHLKYPEVIDISQKKGRPVKPLLECNGFCGINDLSERSSTEKELNYTQLSIW